MHVYLASVLCLFLAGLQEPVGGPPHWRVADTPSLSIGSPETDGPALFGVIAGAVRLSSGVVVVADRSSLELRYFSPRGQYLRTTGRKGGGPGEFQAMSFVLRCAGDSVYVYDGALFRMSVFGPDGHYAGAANLRKWLANGMTPYDASCNPSGVIAFVNRTPEALTLPPREGPMRPQIEILVVTRNDSVRGLGRFPATEMYFKGSEAGPRHLGRRTTVGVGTRVVYVGTGDTYEVSSFSLSGARLSSFREVRNPVPVRPAQIEAYVNEYVSIYRGRANAGALAEYFRDLVWPDNYPAYGRLLVDSADNLWVQDYPVPGETLSTWTVYRPSGKKVAIVALPAAFQLLEADKDFVFGVWRDDDGVQSVRQYTLVH